MGGSPALKDRLLDLLEDTSLGVVTAATALLLGLVSHSPALWGEAVPKCCKLLAKLTHPNAAGEFGAEYVYHKTVNPWLQVKLLRLLQYYPPPEKEEVARRLEDALAKIINETAMQKHVNANNAAHAVLFVHFLHRYFGHPRIQSRQRISQQLLLLWLELHALAFILLHLLHRACTLLTHAFAPTYLNAQGQLPQEQ